MSIRDTAVKDGECTAAGFSVVHRKEVRARIKYHIIYFHRNEYPVSVMCKFFGVSRSGYYDFVRRLDMSAPMIK